ncbi:nucleotidyltransferase family protein [Mesobacillus foraminis]|uniref:nucleotidyltransferase family protein n=1 Tax=Mesobacillus foraminis TaxID=279826 RepID=UPI000EF550F8|nr:nucleotidyltransferase family protein [Mesobacillus foraminis]
MKTAKVSGILLAAGGSSRMGRNKLGMRVGGGTIGGMAFHAAFQSNLDQIIIVTQKGDTLGWMEPPICPSSRWTQAECEEAAGGQAYSLRRGVQAAIEYKSDGIVVLLADQPFVQPAMINHLLSIFRTIMEDGEEVGVIASRHEGRQQPPLLFSESQFSKLLKLRGDTGARKIIQEMPKKLCRSIDYQDWRPFYDIDTEDDYLWIKGNKH